VLAAWLEERLTGFAAATRCTAIALLVCRVDGRALSRDSLPWSSSTPRCRKQAARFRQLDRAEDAQRLERETLARADLVFPVSSPLADYASSRGARHVELMPNAVDLERFADLPPRTDDDGIVAVFSGALRPWHGIYTIAEAWGLLGRTGPRLRVIGDGPGRQLMEEIGAELTGAVPHEQVASLLASSHIGLAPYSADAPDYFSPLKLFEYLAAGLAVVGADIPGIRDVVGDDGAALIAPGNAGRWRRPLQCSQRVSRSGGASARRPDRWLRAHVGSTGTADPSVAAALAETEAAPV
jgi:glycosyltransferase involved in cell wall biosynthesis